MIKRTYEHPGMDVFSVALETNTMSGGGPVNSLNDNQLPSLIQDNSSLIWGD